MRLTSGEHRARSQRTAQESLAASAAESRTGARCLRLYGRVTSIEGRTQDLYVSDLDGTLLTSEGRLSASSRGTLNGLISNRGLLFTYATARSFLSANKVTSGLLLRLPVIVYGGAMVMAPETGEVEWANMFARESVDQVLDQYARQGASPLVYWMSGTEDKVSWLEGAETAGVRSYLSSRRGDPRLLPVRSWSDVDCDRTFYVTVIGGRDEVEPLTKRLRSDPRLARSLHIVQQQDTYRPEETWLELTDANATKATAAQQLLDRLGATRLVSFGDNKNDLPLARIADLSLATANATAEFRQAASGVIGSNDADGVARWLEEAVGGITDEKAKQG